MSRRGEAETGDRRQGDGETGNSLTIHSSQFTVHRSPFTVHHSPLIGVILSPNTSSAPDPMLSAVRKSSSALLSLVVVALCVAIATAQKLPLKTFTTADG